MYRSFKESILFSIQLSKHRPESDEGECVIQYIHFTSYNDVRVNPEPTTHTNLSPKIKRNKHQYLQTSSSFG